MSTAIEQSPAYVAGKWVTSPDRIEVVNPATGLVIGAVPRLGPEFAARALDALASGATAWSTTGILDRGFALQRVARLIRDEAGDLAKLIVSENGKTLAEASGEVEKSAQFFEYYGGMSRNPYGYLLADGRPGTHAEARYEAVGTVLVITPWNDPLLTPARKLAPALFAGNAVIFKPASETPLIALALTRILLAAGLPSTAISALTGKGGEIVDPLLEAGHGLNAVSFTGSTAVGLRIQRALAGSNVRVQTEMGGKNAVVVMADADLELAVPTVIAGAFGQSGQRCTATSRILVAREIEEPFTTKLANAVSALRVGDGLDAETQVGPLVSAGQRDTVVGFVERAEQAGGVIRAQGIVADGLRHAGFFVSPTLLTNVSNSAELWTDEVFGPVIATRTFETLDEAIGQVNASTYGLSAAIFTESLASSTKFTNQVNAGQVSVNLPTSGWDIHHPFGGFKDSGSGYKEQGTEVLNFYTRVKTVAVRAQ
ncbi:aldehyde dehydrogenase family protein [Leucobacter sp. W1038]|uniref:aldehyde dehydrogenase family protein n=1 Tax=Leucobacter sp. W1038 TaxID=3438281 RepID=UPI003D9917EF